MTKTGLIILCIMFLFTACKQNQEKEPIEWIFVEGGNFHQGKNQFIVSPKGDTIQGFTSPSRLVQLDDFYISAYEISVKQFRAFCESTGKQMP